MTTATEVISYEEILSDLKAIVEEFGADYVYVKPSSDGGCKYAHEDGPGCIVGHFLARRGVPLERLKEFDDLSYGTVIGLKVEGAIPFGLTEKGELLLTFVQRSQDRYHPWGAALEAAAHGETLPYQGI